MHKKFVSVSTSMLSGYVQSAKKVTVTSQSTYLSFGLWLRFGILNSGKEFFLMVSWIDTVISSITVFTKFLYCFWPKLSIDLKALKTSSDAQSPVPMFISSSTSPWKRFPKAFIVSARIGRRRRKQLPQKCAKRHFHFRSSSSGILVDLA